MAVIKGQFEDALGNVLHNETSADLVKTSDNSTVQAVLSAIPTTYETQANASSTYATKTELQNLSAGIVQVVATRPASGSEGVIYLVETATQNVYDKYTWENNSWVSLGSTFIDLSNYVQKLATSPAGTFGESADKTLTYGGTFKVLQAVLNADGQTTSLVEKTMTMPASDDTVGIPVVENNGSAPANLASGAVFFRKASA